ncbi:ABC transporter permease subunit [Hydrogenimonas thermophila]|uniref:ABC transporter permease n=1 Tax=Hydrogenimonas thermophila TaxID=223786 RepID=UPI0029372BD8|nr:ABC transporter permease subunit [Hydrogenimonas thermophila]WOE71191.1 ABC transporter permease subunit [Hydrogenimonas thermophila]WOE73711.1 ABC transporter permease subunit [Hydrogenimonas thermophila]
MKSLALVAYLDIKESLRAKWFYVYALVFGGLMGLFFISGITNAVVMGFTGLSRLLLVFMQVTIIILPIFILITTVKSISADRESNVLEYMLSFPISLKAYYWGKIVGRFMTVFFPVIIALFIGVVWGIIKGGAELPWMMVFLYSGLIFSMSVLFLGIAFFISTFVKSHDIALGISFSVWIFLLAFIDVALIGLMMQNRVPDGIIITIAMLNPLEAFRIGAIALFDPELTVIGPVAYYLLDTLGHNLLIFYAIVYPIVIGIMFAISGYILFSKKDLL